MSKLFIASDHAGFDLKESIITYLKQHQIFVHDLGTKGHNSVDYPDYAHHLSIKVQEDQCQGILICGSANGVAITANKYSSIRAAVCWSKEIAILARQHNDANVLCLPARFINNDEALECVKAFIHTDFEGGRHKFRIEKINIKYEI